jgi:hypothetical protein
MIISDEIIKYNLSLLEEVKLEYPILEDYEKGLIKNESVSRIGLDDYVSFINYKKDIIKYGQQLFYTDKIYFEEVIEKVVELSYNKKVKKIFSNKSPEDFHKIYNDYKKYRRYSKNTNISYCEGLELAEPIIINYFIQNKIDINDNFLKRPNFFTTKYKKPKYYSRELKMTQNFIEDFILFAKEKDLDIRKCNINTLISEINNRLKPLMSIEDGLQVKYIGDNIPDLTFDKLYNVLGSRISYIGYLEVKIADDRGLINFQPYSIFEEVSRQRNDIFKELGI